MKNNGVKMSKAKYKKVKSAKSLYEALKDGKDIYYCMGGEISILLGEEVKFMGDTYDNAFAFTDIYENIQKGKVWLLK